MILPYVYKLIHKETGEFYIGYREANELPSHIDLGGEYTTSSKVINDMGFHNFNMEILAEFINPDRKIAGNDAYDIENEMIAEVFHDPLCLNGHHRNRGEVRFKSHMGHPRPHTDETKIKMREYHSNPEFKLKHSLTQKIVQNRPEVVAKKREANIGRKCSVEAKINMSKSQTGRKHTEVTRSKISEANSGLKRSEEQIANIRNSQMRDDVREKKRRAMLGKVASEETKIKMRKPKSEDHKIKTAIARSKSFTLMSPDGIVYRGLGIGAFCEEHGLSIWSMQCLCKGETSIYKGWTGKYDSYSLKDDMTIEV